LPDFCGSPNVKFCYFADMDQLSTKQQETLRKNSTNCLRVMVARIGDVADDELETMVSEPEKTDRAIEVELQLVLKKMWS